MNTIRSHGREAKKDKRAEDLPVRTRKDRGQSNCHWTVPQAPVGKPVGGEVDIIMMGFSQSISDCQT